MSTDSIPKSTGRGLLLGGLVLAALGIAAYAAQLASQRLTVPWYMPVLAFLGAGLVAASLRRRRSFARVASLVALLGLVGFEVLALSLMRLPAYDGPVAVGSPFPGFEAKRSDGTPLTQASLAGESHTAMVFFRGRW